MEKASERERGSETEEICKTERASEMKKRRFLRLGGF